MQTDQNVSLAPAAIVIFGITGDLAQRKLLPALYHLIHIGILHPQTVIVGVTRRQISASELLDETRLCINETDGVCHPDTINRMHDMLHMRHMDLDDDVAYDALREYLDELDARAKTPLARLFYLSIPPAVFGPIVAQLGASGLNGNGARLLVEKPFGYDLTSAQALIAETSRHFKESQLFRIDHYLAKETVQNILTFRFRNPIFEALWSAKFIGRIEIEASERIGIEGRSVFYEQTGALRDLVQSHLLQLLAVTTMEAPEAMNASGIHKARLKLLESIPPLSAQQVATHALRGQYDGYQDEVQNPGSNTETFAALRLGIDNDRWRGVPIILKTGKALHEKSIRVRVFFRGNGEDDNCNCLTFAIQPHEGIELDLQVKRPGFEHALETAAMEFRYDRHFEEHDGHPDAYERVLVDAIRGDRTLFATSNEVLASWRILQLVVTAWSANGDGLRIYPQGSNGPELPASLDN